MLRQGVGSIVGTLHTVRNRVPYLSGSVNKTSLAVMSFNEVSTVPVVRYRTYWSGRHTSLILVKPFFRKRKARGGKGRRDREPFTPEDQQQQQQLPPPPTKERTPPTSAGKDDNKEAATEDASAPEVVYVAAPLPKVRYSNNSAKFSQKSVQRTSSCNIKRSGCTYFQLTISTY